MKSQDQPLPRLCHELYSRVASTWRNFQVRPLFILHHELSTPHCK